MTTGGGKKEKKAMGEERRERPGVQVGGQGERRTKRRQEEGLKKGSPENGEKLGGRMGEGS